MPSFSGDRFLGRRARCCDRRAGGPKAKIWGFLWAQTAQNSSPGGVLPPAVVRLQNADAVRKAAYA